jgi:ADP-heptose:LPS heptosyltransferase
MRYRIINRKKLYATVFADIVGNIIFLPRLLFRGGGEIIPEDVREILIIRTAYIGDAVMTVPILKPLRKKFPNSRVSFLTSTSAGKLLENNPYLDEIITYDPFWFYPSEKRNYIEFMRKMKERVFDIIIETRGDIRELLFLVWPLKARHKVGYKVGGGGYFLTHVVPYQGLKHRVEYHLDIIRYLDCDTEDVEWGVYLTENEKDHVRNIITESGIRGAFISVHAGARVPLKRWMEERFVRLCDSIIERYKMPVVLIGDDKERDLIDSIVKEMQFKPISLAGRLSLRELAGVLSESMLFICNDSAPMHIAAAMKTPTVAIFGPSKSIGTGPYGDIHKVVEKDFQCRYMCDESSCHYPEYHACMRDIEVEDVLLAVEDIMGELKIECSGLTH